MSEGWPEFFIDVSSANKLIYEQLVGMGIRVQRHVDHFPSNVDDDIWLRAAGERNWTVLSLDKAILKRPNLINAVRKFKVRFFVLRVKNQKTENFIEVIKKHFDSILVLSLYVPAPFKASVTTQDIMFRWLGERMATPRGKATGLNIEV